MKEEDDAYGQGSIEQGRSRIGHTPAVQLRVDELRGQLEQHEREKETNQAGALIFR